MKILSFFIAAIVSCSCVFAASAPERVELLASKIILNDSTGYFMLSDGSLWRVVAFSPRWRTPAEWWNDTPLSPEEYNCVPDNWKLNDQIEAYSKYGNLYNIREEDGVNYDELRQSTHLLVHSGTGQALFAVPLSPYDCVCRLFDDANKNKLPKPSGSFFSSNARCQCHKQR